MASRFDTHIELSEDGEFYLTSNTNFGQIIQYLGVQNGFHLSAIIAVRNKVEGKWVWCKAHLDGVCPMEVNVYAPDLKSMRRVTYPELVGVYLTAEMALSDH